MTTAAILCLLIFLLCLYKFHRNLKLRAYKLPPGPRGLPILGNNLQIARNAPAQFSKWAKQYGKLYTITIGNGSTALVVNDAKLMKQVFGTMASTGRFHSVIMDKLFDGPNGIISSEGPVWQEQRNFCVKSLNALGCQRGKQVESMILSEVGKLSEWLQKEMAKKGKVQLSEILTETSGNTLWTLITGESSNVVNLMDDWLANLQKASNSGLAFFSWIKYVAPNKSGYIGYEKACQNLLEFVENCFAEHKMQLEKGHCSADLVSAYIEHMENMKDYLGSSFSEKSGFKHSVRSILGLLIAGTENNATTLNWLIFYLSVHPQVQQNVHNEIDKVIGQERDPTTDDRIKMPYTEAVILETLRMSTSAPFGIIHRLLEDVQFLEYKLPKDMLLIPNIYHVHHDANTWGDPENFRPERFLENTSSQLNNMKEFIVSFQPGKRVCLGEAMAKDIIFLFATKLLQSFSFHPEATYTKEMYMEPDVGYFLTAKRYGIIVLMRG